MDGINIAEFYLKTSPTYYISYCKFEHLDCRHLWRKKLTFNGICIVFDPLLAVDYHKDQIKKNKIADASFELG